MKKLIACLFGLILSMPAMALPSGTTELEYITFNSTQILETNFVPNQDTEIRAQYTTGDTVDTWLYVAGTDNPRVTLYVSNAGNQRFGNTMVASKETYGGANITHTIIQNKSGLTFDGNVWTYKDAVGNFTATDSLKIGGITGTTATFKGKIHYLQIYDNGSLARDYIPARQGNTVGFYDRKNNNFISAAGLVAGPDMDGCRNLFNKNGNLLVGTYNANTGAWVDNDAFRTLKNIPASPNTNYTLSANNILSGSNAFSIQAWSSDNQWLGTVALNTLSNVGTQTVITGQTPANTAYLSVCFSNRYRDINTIQLELGNTATRYTPYDSACFNTCPNGQVLQTYTSATGTVTQNGTPTPDAPVEPKFYIQGNMTLRAVGSGNEMIADSYNASTGKITRNVNSYTFTGNENFTASTAYGSALIITAFDSNKGANKNIAPICNYFLGQPTTNNLQEEGTCFFNSSGHLYFRTTLSATDFKTWLAERYAAGNPVVVYFARSAATTEDWAAEQCVAPIKIATVKYNNAAFSDVVTGLNTAISTIKDVVANTISQTSAIANLQSGKQTKPADAACPAGKKCLLVEDSSGVPHWYEIVESYYNPTLPVGYTELAYLESTGTQYIDTGIVLTDEHIVDFKFMGTGNFFGTRGNSGASFGATGSTNLSVDLFASTGVISSARLSYTIDPNSIYMLHMENGNRILKDANGTVLGQNTYESTSFTTTYTAPIFTIRWQSSTPREECGNFKLYYFKIYDANGLVRDFVPARRESDGVLGMYDLANNQFYTNAGTGTFNAGPVVLPAGFTALDYIQSSGTQYIDTGITAQATKLQVNFKMQAFATAYTSFFGAVGDPTRNGFRVYRTENGPLSVQSVGSTTASVNFSNPIEFQSTVYNNNASNSNFVVNGTTVTLTSVPKLNLDRNIAVFTSALGSNGGISGTGPFKLWSFTIIKDDTVAFNGVPAQQGNTVGLFDLVSGEFFTDANGGNFTAGDAVQ